MPKSTSAGIRRSNASHQRPGGICICLVVVLLFALASPGWCQSADFLKTKELAEKGDVAAQKQLGYLFSTGDGVQKNNVEALRWLRLAAEKGDANAQWFVGDIYFQGSGVPRNYSEALRWYSKAAEQGHALAQNDLGWMYFEGSEVPRNYREAMRWFYKAAEQGSGQACQGLGLSFLKGYGVEKDGAEAFRWFMKGANQGEAESQFDLAACYRDGIGVQRDEVEAMRWYFRAAQQGMPDAQYSLAVGYEEGRGLRKDFVEAYKWYGLVAVQKADAGLASEAAKACSELKKKMSPQQIASAQHLVTVFIPSIERPKTQAKDNQGIAKNRKPDRGDESTPSASGTGFFITDDGFLMTNAHVVKNGSKFELVTSAGSIAAKVVKVDEANDLALIKAEGRFMPLSVVASRTVRLGSTVATVGFPNVGLQGFAPKLGKGEISALSGGQDDARYFQISVPVQPGNSGGALVDERGNVVGIVSAKLSAKAALATSGALPENVNYAVKSSFLLGFLESVPDVAAKLKDPNTKDAKFEDVVNSAKQATALVLVY